MLIKFKKLIQVLITPEYRKVFLDIRVAASTEHDQLLKNLEPQAIKYFVDIGSNRGQFALAARHHFPEAVIHCFEPLDEPAGILKKVFLNDPRVILHNLAIGASSQEAIMHVSAADDSSSVLPISDLQASIFPGTAERETRIVTVKPLDAVLDSSDIENPAFLKIDVQGFEAEVLKGCGGLLCLFSYIYVECSFMPLYEGQVLADEILIFLLEKGFSLSGVYNLHYDRSGTSVQGDFLFARNRK